MSQPTEFHIPVDLAHNKANDEYYRDPKQLQLASVLLGVLFMVVGGYIAWSMDFNSGGIMALIAFATVGLVFWVIAGMLPKKVGTPQYIYDNYPLAPAVIVKTSDDTVTIMGLVDAATDVSRGTPQRAIVTREIRKLPGHTRAVGERVPVVVVPGRRAVFKDRSHWAEMTLMPIAWATKDRGLIHKASQLIPEAYWRKLKSNVDRADEVIATRTKLIVIDK